MLGCGGLIVHNTQTGFGPEVFASQEPEMQEMVIWSVRSLPPTRLPLRCPVTLFILEPSSNAQSALDYTLNLAEGSHHDFNHPVCKTILTTPFFFCIQIALAGIVISPCTLHSHQSLSLPSVRIVYWIAATTPLAAISFLNLHHGM